MQYHFSGVVDLPAPSANKKGTLTKDDGNVNENGKKVLGLGLVYMEVGDPR